jgi:predicted nucleotidyltransferase
MRWVEYTPGSVESRAGDSKVIGADMLEEIVERLVVRFHPERIILFGSHARGEATDASDMDLLVVADTDLPPEERFPALRPALADPALTEKNAFRGLAPPLPPPRGHRQREMSPLPRPKWPASSQLIGTTAFAHPQCDRHVGTLHVGTLLYVCCLCVRRVSSEFRGRRRHALLALGLLLLPVAHELLDGADIVGPFFAEMPQVESLDEDGKRGFPGFLIVVRQLPELLGVHAQFAGHLDVRVREVESLSRVNPDLVLR